MPTTDVLTPPFDPIRAVAGRILRGTSIDAGRLVDRTVAGVASLGLTQLAVG